ncbi:MAG: exo-alpha-sialidase [Gemmatimonadetes bacterium]|nr:exo-alpha-sialidase [Gemmatimonadota bacterium]
MFRVDRTRGGWSIGQTAFLGDHCSMILHDPRDHSVYAALGHGHFGVKMHRSTDLGATWQPIATPVYPERPKDYVPKMKPAEGTEYPWTLNMVWSLEAGGPRENGRLWCGTLPGGLFRSDDRGEHWSLVESLWYEPLREEWFGGGADQPGIHSIAVDPRDSNHLTLGISCGGAWITRDGGNTWQCGGKGMRAEFMPPDRMWDTNIQDPHRLVACPTAPDVLWVQHHNGIFKSTDAAASWSEIKDVQPSVFGFAVVVHPRDPDCAWFVPAIKDEKRIPAGGRVVVNRTRDGGRRFQQLTRGLPQEHAYDLVFRHAMDIDAGGERLAFGSTTGSLWISENGGDAWQHLSAHLPPVYAVRFV